MGLKLNCFRKCVPIEEICTFFIFSLIPLYFGKNPIDLMLYKGFDSFIGYYSGFRIPLNIFYLECNFTGELLEYLSSNYL